MRQSTLLTPHKHLNNQGTATKFTRVLALLGILLTPRALSPNQAEAQCANSHNGYGYNSHASQMVRDHTNQRRSHHAKRTSR